MGPTRKIYDNVDYPARPPFIMEPARLSKSLTLHRARWHDVMTVSRCVPRRFDAMDKSSRHPGMQRMQCVSCYIQASIVQHITRRARSAFVKMLYILFYYLIVTWCVVLFITLDYFVQRGIETNSSCTQYISLWQMLLMKNICSYLILNLLSVHSKLPLAYAGATIKIFCSKLHYVSYGKIL